MCIWVLIKLITGVYLGADIVNNCGSYMSVCIAVLIEFITRGSYMSVCIWVLIELITGSYMSVCTC